MIVVLFSHNIASSNKALLTPVAPANMYIGGRLGMPGWPGIRLGGGGPPSLSLDLDLDRLLSS